MQRIARLDRRHLAGWPDRLVLLERIDVRRVGDRIIDFANYGIGLLRETGRRQQSD